MQDPLVPREDSSVIINELKECILVEWEKINQKRIKKLCKSLPRRMIAITRKSGGSTKY